MLCGMYFGGLAEWPLGFVAGGSTILIQHPEVSSPAFRNLSSVPLHREGGQVAFVF